MPITTAENLLILNYEIFLIEQRNYHAVLNQ